MQIHNLVPYRRKSPKINKSEKLKKNFSSAQRRGKNSSTSTRRCSIFFDVGTRIGICSCCAILKDNLYPEGVSFACCVFCTAARPVWMCVMTESFIRNTTNARCWCTLLLPTQFVVPVSFEFEWSNVQTENLNFSKQQPRKWRHDARSLLLHVTPSSSRLLIKSPVTRQP